MESRRWVVVKEGNLGHECEALALSPAPKCLVEGISIRDPSKYKSPVKKGLSLCSCLEFYSTGDYSKVGSGVEKA